MLINILISYSKRVGMINLLDNNQLKKEFKDFIFLRK